MLEYRDREQIGNRNNAQQSLQKWSFSGPNQCGRQGLASEDVRTTAVASR